MKLPVAPLAEFGPGSVKLVTHGWVSVGVYNCNGELLAVEDRRRCALRALGCGRGNPDEASACKPGGARMNGTDEPGPCDGNTNTS